ncbi:hypothetical protein J3F84DRAFT_388491 [Trichoderma pleuroticola]
MAWSSLENMPNLLFWRVQCAFKDSMSPRSIRGQWNFRYRCQMAWSSLENMHFAAFFIHPKSPPRSGDDIEQAIWRWIEGGIRGRSCFQKPANLTQRKRYRC